MKNRIGFIVLALACCAPSRASTLYSVSLDVQATAQGATTNSFNQEDVPATSISSGNITNGSSGSNEGGWSDSSTAYGTVDLGNLHLFESATGTGGSGYAATDAYEGWTDSLTIGPGSGPMQFLVVMDLEGTVSAAGDPTTGGDSQNQAGFQASGSGSTAVMLYEDPCQKNSNGVTQGCGAGWMAAPTVETGILTANPGETVSLSGYVSSVVSAAGGVVSYRCGVNNCLAVYSSGALADFSNTAIFGVIPITPGATYTSASGTDYDIPEPATLPLAVVGLAALISVFRKNGRSRHGGVKLWSTRRGDFEICWTREIPKKPLFSSPRSHRTTKRAIESTRLAKTDRLCVAPFFG